MMERLVGIKWGKLPRETQEWLLERSNCTDGRDCSNVKEDKCIVDFEEGLSVAGKIIDDEIIIKDNAIIYSSINDIELVSKEFNFTINDVLIVNEAAEIWGITEGAIRASIKARKFIRGVDFRKAGRITLITKEAMVKVYGELEL